MFVASNVQMYKNRKTVFTSKKATGIFMEFTRTSFFSEIPTGILLEITTTGIFLMSYGQDVSPAAVRKIRHARGAL